MQRDWDVLLKAANGPQRSQHGIAIQSSRYFYFCYFCIMRGPCIANNPAAISVSVVYLYSPIGGSNSESIAISIELSGLYHVFMAMLLNSEPARITKRVIHHHWRHCSEDAL